MLVKIVWILEYLHLKKFNFTPNFVLAELALTLV